MEDMKSIKIKMNTEQGQGINEKEPANTPLTQGKATKEIKDTNKCYLHRLSTDEKYEIHEGENVLGRMSTKSNIVIRDNKTISRAHAQIVKYKDSFNIRDLESKNGTYLNDRKLVANISYDIRNGDKIRLSDEEFLFKNEEKKSRMEMTNVQESMIERIKQKAKEKKELIDADPNADEHEKKTISMILEFLKNVDDFNRISKGTVYNMFTYLGFDLAFDDYREMYEQLMEEVNRKYIYVDPDWFFTR